MAIREPNGLGVIEVEYLCSLLDREWRYIGAEFKGLQAAIGDESPATLRLGKQLRQLWEIQRIFDERKRELRQIEEVRRRAAEAGVIKQND